MYPWKDPAPFLDMENSQKWLGGGHRIIQTLIVTMLYSNAEKDEFEWKKAWLERSNFKVGGMIPNMGRKSRKQYVARRMYPITDTHSGAVVTGLTCLGSISAKCTIRLVQMCRISFNETASPACTLPPSNLSRPTSKTGKRKGMPKHGSLSFKGVRS